METFGTRLRSYRNQRCLTQHELALLAGRAGGRSYTLQAIWRLENGRQRPRPRTVRALAAALGVDPYELLTGTPSALPRKVNSGPDELIREPCKIDW